MVEVVVVAVEALVFHIGDDVHIVGIDEEGELFSDRIAYV